ncbi:MAG: hypothetical protein K2U26_06045 [Cyclobacteriaceae bacterium]|nr:hypothetical protein [Cyclobacteriaceae bacterium]
MTFSRTLLYPFSVNTPYFEGYAWAMELASRMKARLQLFTTLPHTPGYAFPSDPVYHSLLEAQGYYLQHYQHQVPYSKEVKREPFITRGALKDELLAHIRKHSIDIIIIDPAFSNEHHEALKEIVRESGAAIILHPENALTGNSDAFYERLRQAELYKLPDNFFSTLSKDGSVFNYLRTFFQKRSHPQKQ